MPGETAEKAMFAFGALMRSQVHVGRISPSRPTPSPRLCWRTCISSWRTPDRRGLVCEGNRLPAIHASLGGYDTLAEDDFDGETLIAE